MQITAFEWLVVAGAALAIVAVNWYFLFGKKTARATTADTVQRATIRIEGGYDPSIIEVTAGRPLQLTFDRRENNPCSDELVVGSLGIRRELPAFQKTVVEFTPPAPGRYEFTCGMGMLHGAVIAR
jgi:Cu+-exporting ATPase